MTWYVALVLLVGAERLVELVVAKRNLRWSLARGGIVQGQSHYPFMVVLHIGLLAGCLIEALTTGRPVISMLTWTMLGLVFAAQALRWWCITALGKQWNTQIVVIPGAPRVMRGPYRYSWLPHPNYIAVAVEGFALPLVGGAWMTALVFTCLNAGLMVARIRAENAALGELVEAT
ncbi:MAG: hypothetical protein HOQ05_05150 [Corynebacteriales bacterium]|nr:hypothetical protein [Mycobacteriales bacterium]